MCFTTHLTKSELLPKSAVEKNHFFLQSCFFEICLRPEKNTWLCSPLSPSHFFIWKLISYTGMFHQWPEIRRSLNPSALRKRFENASPILASKGCVQPFFFVVFFQVCIIHIIPLHSVWCWCIHNVSAPKIPFICSIMNKSNESSEREWARECKMLNSKWVYVHTVYATAYKALGDVICIISCK